jgi:hypothetical protein
MTDPTDDDLVDAGDGGLFSRSALAAQGIDADTFAEAMRLITLVRDDTGAITGVSVADPDSVRNLIERCGLAEWDRNHQ